jgi:hypothetical protein
VPHLDNRLLITSAAGQTAERLGRESSYSYQLAALTEALAGERAFGIDVNDAVANAELIDAVYTRAGVVVERPRPPSRRRTPAGRRPGRMKP